MPASSTSPKVVDFPEGPLGRGDRRSTCRRAYSTRPKAALAAHDCAKGWGRVINIASAHGLVASGEKAAYVTAKHGLVGLTKVIAIETANSGVTCNAICPGWVLTALVQKQIEARAAAQGVPYSQAHDDLLREKQPMLQFTSPEQIGGLAVFLRGEAASTMTGAALSIDGGWPRKRSAPVTEERIERCRRSGVGYSRPRRPVEGGKTMRWLRYEANGI